MKSRQTYYRGCLMGLAVGDAMGYTVDDRPLSRIQADYGPDGLLGYDLVNGCADISSHTQLAAYACNGLLLGLTRGQMQGVMAPYVRYIALAEREWGQTQQGSGRAATHFCWVGRVEELRGRRCTDTHILDALNRARPGSMEEPVTRFDSAGALTTAVPVGLFFDPRRADRTEIDRLGAEALALTHGAPEAFLAGGALAHMIGRIIWDGQKNLKALVRETAELLQERFGREYAQTGTVRELMNLALTLSGSHRVSCTQAMEQLRCETAAEVLAGSIYACLCYSGNFDEAMIAAVNHSGCSAAVGAVTGALLGAMLGEKGLPDFYLEPVACIPVLRELADDMYQGCPMDRSSRMFDDDWDRKYVQGEY